MKSPLARLFAATPLALLFAALLVATGPARAVEAGGKAPEAAFKPLGERTAPASLGQLKGQVVYVDFWASWCVPCLRSMPALQSLYRRHREQGFVVVGINKDIEANDAERFLRRFPVTFPLVLDPADKLARDFDVKTMPSGYLVDRAGVVRHVHRGFTADTETSLQREIAALLLEKP